MRRPAREYAQLTASQRATVNRIENCAHLGYTAGIRDALARTSPADRVVVLEFLTGLKITISDEGDTP